MDEGHDRERTYRVTGIVEKPEPGTAPSNLAVIGRYVLTPKIFDKLEQTQRGAGGEIQLTDAIQALMEEQSVFGYAFEGTRYDAGTTMGWLRRRWSWRSRGRSSAASSATTCARWTSDPPAADRTPCGRMRPAAASGARHRGETSRR